MRYTRQKNTGRSRKNSHRYGLPNHHAHNSNWIFILCATFSRNLIFTLDEVRHRPMLFGCSPMLRCTTTRVNVNTGILVNIPNFTVPIYGVLLMVCSNDLRCERKMPTVNIYLSLLGLFNECVCICCHNGSILALFTLSFIQSTHSFCPLPALFHKCG